MIEIQTSTNLAAILMKVESVDPKMVVNEQTTLRVIQVQTSQTSYLLLDLTWIWMVISMLL